jgi:hypothetical protein
MRTAVQKGQLCPFGQISRREGNAFGVRAHYFGHGLRLADIYGHNLVAASRQRAHQGAANKT